GRGSDAAVQTVDGGCNIASAGAGVVQNIVGAGGRGQLELAGSGSAGHGGVIAVSPFLGQPGVTVAASAAGAGGANGHVADAVGLVGCQAADTVVAVGVGLEVGGAGGNGLVGVGADLEVGGGEAAVKQVQTVELGGGGDALQFLRQLLDFGVQRRSEE